MGKQINDKLMANRQLHSRKSRLYYVQNYFKITKLMFYKNVF